MVDIVFGDERLSYMLDMFALDLDEEGYVTREGDRLLDATGTPIHRDDLHSALHFEAHGPSVDDDGYVITDNGDRLIDQTTAGTDHDPVVPFEDTDGTQAGLLRDSVASVLTLVEST